MEINRCLYLDADHNLTLREEPIPRPEPGQVLIKIAANGICGSDLHFYKDGRLGNFLVTEPYVPGHEASGTVVGLGGTGSRFKEGDRVVIEPGIPCGKCALCKSGRYNLCPDVVFLSAPPINGTFCDYVCVAEHFVHKVPDGLAMDHAALAEPVAVAVHAVNRGRVQAGDVGVIVGSGPIGLLTLQAFKARGGSSAICVDVLPERLEWAKKLGADQVLLASGSEPAVRDAADVVFETAGSDQATALMFDMVKPGGRCVQVGWTRNNRVSIDIAQLMEKEIDYMGVNRYANAFETALAWLKDGRIDAPSLITQRFPLDQAKEGFDWALAHPAETVKVLVEN